MRGSDGREMPAVYQPAEDSRLLAETVVERLDGGERVLEVGVGSGFIASRVMSEVDAWVVGSDINPTACWSARSAGVSVVRASLVAPFSADSFDVVVFNPPYLPTPPEHEWDDPLEAALSGGVDGRRVIRPFLDDVGRVLQSTGVAYLLVSSLTGVDAVVEYAADGGLVGREIVEEAFPFERLVVLEITNDNS